MGYVWAIPLLPMAAFAVLAPLSRRARNAGVWVAVAAMTGSLALSLAAFVRAWAAGGHAGGLYDASVAFGRVGDVVLRYGVALEPVSAAIAVVVALVGLCVQVYSLGYMRGDRRIGWYYAVLSLFTGAMLALVYANDFLMMFMAWEVMGLCSYLLIGFWHEREGPRKASLKAFLTTRVGDVGFMLALAVVMTTVGTFDTEAVLAAPEWAAQPGAATATALLLLVAAAGKSAQVPLHVWLPDAMAGPTPVSALIHAATMVAAGVFVIGRALPIFEAGPGALEATLFIGCLSALLAGLIATVQDDVKKVLAYSTISQLGYMVAALGAGSAVAALFHLVTHAFFKSLLFLGAGAVIHGTHTQDMREMGGLARRMPWTTATFTVGTLALAGVAPFSGFFSKDEILAVMLRGGHPWAFAIALGAGGVTAFYMARLWFLVFAGDAQRPEAHEGSAVMVVPMVVLAGLTLVAGFASPSFAGFLGHHGKWPEPGLALASTMVAAAGILAGWLVYGRAVVSHEALRARTGVLYDALVQKLFFDLAVERLLVRPYVALADALAVFDSRVVDGLVDGAAATWVGLSHVGRWVDERVVDGAVNGVAVVVQHAGGRLRRLQVGRVQTYQRLVVAGLIVLMLWTVLKGA